MTFWSATNSDNATGATANFSIRKFFGQLSQKLLELASSKINHNVTHHSLYISTGNDVTIYLGSAANYTKVLIWGPVWIVIS